LPTPCQILTMIQDLFFQVLQSLLSGWRHGTCSLCVK